jgi:hypothetical protein
LKKINYRCECIGKWQPEFIVAITIGGNTTFFRTRPLVAGNINNTGTSTPTSGGSLADENPKGRDFNRLPMIIMGHC